MAPPICCFRPGLGDELARAGQRGAHRGAEPLGEVDPRGVEGRRPLAGRDAAGDDRVQQTRAVEMGGQAMAARHVGHRAHARQRPDRAAAQVAGLLDPHQATPGEVAEVGPDARLHRRRVELPARAVERARVHSGERGRAATLEVNGVRGVVGQHLLTGPAVHAQGDLVAHGPGGQEDGRLLAEQVGHHLLQEIHGRVLVLLLVAHLRLAHEAAHLGGGARHGVAVEIDLDRGVGLAHGPRIDQLGLARAGS
jgi:hypothetical protein